MKIIIPGIPIQQSRPRYYQCKGVVNVYDPQAKEKNIIKKLLLSLDEKQFNYPRISFIFQMPICKSTRKKDLPLYNSGIVKHTKKPDVDNLIKFYLDCMDGIFFTGDQIVSLGPCMKLYNPNPKTVIWIEETGPLVAAYELDTCCLDLTECDIQSLSEMVFHSC